MKTFKIIIGFLLLYGAGKEYLNASRQLDTPYDIGILIAILLLLLLSTWLIGSGFSKRKLKFKSFEFLKFFIISFVALAFFVIVSLGSKVIPSNFAEINGITVPLGKCMDGNQRIIPDKQERLSYCKCFAEKVLNDSTLKSKYRRKLENDDFLKVIAEIQKSQIFLELGFENCMKSVKMEWTNNLANSMKEKLKKQLIGTEFENTNDIEKYCDCMIKEYRKLPINKIMEDGFMISDKALEIDKRCTIESVKK
ncbi:hypothetical protein [uncultured Algibacter sp.]|uniref:hypothetical protein n=1 Tax=uncultured Algibacter sp. TaxID=298659 RepID=UPI0026328B45|nr:hypothetical protein [uncultured Algibacter sp.]